MISIIDLMTKIEKYLTQSQEAKLPNTVLEQQLVGIKRYMKGMESVVSNASSSIATGHS